MGQNSKILHLLPSWITPAVHTKCKRNNSTIAAFINGRCALFEQCRWEELHADAISYRRPSGSKQQPTTPPPLVPTQDTQREGAPPIPSHLRAQVAKVTSLARANAFGQAAAAASESAHVLSEQICRLHCPSGEWWKEVMAKVNTLQTKQKRQFTHDTVPHPNGKWPSPLTTDQKLVHFASRGLLLFLSLIHI